MRKIILITFLTIIEVSCTPQKETTPSNAVLEYQNFASRHINWEEALKQEIERYLVYIYSDYCGHCQSIKNDVLEYANKNIDFYFVVYDSSIPISQEHINIGIEEIERITIKGTPTLLEIKNGTIINEYAGDKQIISFINYGY